MIGDSINNESPEAIKADIERKRGEMSEKINTIQERLSPENLKAQAQDAIRDAVSSSSEAVSTYFRDNSQQMARSVASTMRRNPLPTALIGLGLGWLAVEALGGGDNDSGRRYNDNARRAARSDIYRGPAERVGYGYSDSQTRYGSDYGAQYGYQSQYGTPYSQQYGSQQYSYEESGSEGPMDKAKNLAGEARERVGQFTETVGEKVGELTDRVGEKVNEATDQTRDRAGSMGERVGSTVEEARARAELYGEDARMRAARMSEQASMRMQQAGEYVGEQAAYASEQARMAAQRTGQVVQRSYYETPVWYGAVALAVGAVAGLLLPSTKIEDEWLGETRDRFVSEAEGMAEEAAQRAKQVVEEVKPELEEAAQRIVSDVKETGQMAVEQVRSTGKDALGNVKETVRSTAQDVTGGSSGTSGSGTSGSGTTGSGTTGSGTYRSNTPGSGASGSGTSGNKSR